MNPKKGDQTMNNGPRAQMDESGIVPSTLAEKIGKPASHIPLECFTCKGRFNLAKEHFKIEDGKLKLTCPHCDQKSEINI